MSKTLQLSGKSKIPAPVEGYQLHTVDSTGKNKIWYPYDDTMWKQVISRLDWETEYDYEERQQSIYSDDVLRIIVSWELKLNAPSYKLWFDDNHPFPPVTSGTLLIIYYSRDYFVVARPIYEGQSNPFWGAIPFINKHRDMLYANIEDEKFFEKPLYWQWTLSPNKLNEK